MPSKTKSSVPTNTLRIGLLGLGTVGSGVAEIIHRHGPLLAQRAGMKLQIVRAVVRRPSRKRTGAAAKIPVTRDSKAVVGAPDIDIVVELLGGTNPAYALMQQALAHGQSVVTANKAVLAQHAAALFRAARKHGADVYFEAAVAGGIPIIRTLREGLAGDHITRVCGILNGTTNYILSRLEAGDSYEAALAEAQRLGFAEADPTLDVNGRDAADKLAILAQLAFGTEVKPQALDVEGIEDLTPDVLADARALGCRVKLIATAQRCHLGREEYLDARVHPALVPDDDVMSHVPANQNAVAVQSDALGSTLYQGAGAGSLPTGSAVVGDLIEAARNRKGNVVGRLYVERARNAPRLLRRELAESAYYLRLLVDDKPGVLASVAKILASHHISLASVLQNDRSRGPVPLSLTTHITRHGAMLKALRAVKRLAAVHGRVQVLRRL